MVGEATVNGVAVAVVRIGGVVGTEIDVGVLDVGVNGAACRVERGWRGGGGAVTGDVDPSANERCAV